MYPITSKNVMAIKVMTCYSKVICQIYVNYHKQQVNRQYI